MNNGKKQAETEDRKLDGQIERVTFHSEESGFCVLQVRVRGHREPVTVVGISSGPVPGEWVSADGAWSVDPRHGQQFRAEHIRTTRPDTLEGIEKYLGSGLIKGVGAEYARRLVQAFGREVFEVIEHAAARLERVEGIGRVRRQRIKAAWDEQKAVREIMTFLFSHGVSTTRAFRIYKAYGEQAIETVQRNPYRLAQDIRGIGFTLADQIAMKLGIAKDSELRARAGIEYVLGELTQAGHCAYPRGELVERAVQVLEIDEAVVVQALEHGLAQERLIRDQEVQGRELIYLPRYYFAEKQLAEGVARLARGTHPCPPVILDKAVEWVQRQVGFELAPAQRKALADAVQKPVMVVTGGPGVGKTTLVNAIVKVLQVKKLEVVLCAPTGRAAKRMAETSGLPAKTIHRLLQYDPRNGGFRHNPDHPLQGDVFIVDESSMLDVVLANDLVRALPRRAALIWVGDVDQLPSVGPGCVLRDLIRSGCVPVAELNEVFRQAATSRIITGAHQINRGQMPVFSEKGETGDFYFLEAEDPVQAAEAIRKLVQESIPRKFNLHPLRDIQVLAPMVRGELGVRNLNQLLQQHLNPDGPAVERFGFKYRAGDKVMQTENDYDKEVFNGDIGTIRRIHFDEQELEVDFDGRGVVYEFKELDELALSYAVTVHKSQGSEYPCVVIPIHTQHYMMLQRNLLYTAVTRARRLVVLVGTRKAIALAVRQSDSRTRVTTLIERLKTAFS